METNAPTVSPAQQQSWNWPAVVICVTAFCQLFWGDTPQRLGLLVDGERPALLRLVSHMFIHADWGHLGSNMLVVGLLGAPLVRRTGPLQFLLSYLGSGVLAGLVSLAFLPGGLLLGASAGAYGLMATAALVVPFGTARQDPKEDSDFPWVLALSVLFACVLPAWWHARGLTVATHVNHIAHWIGLLWGMVVPSLVHGRKMLVSAALFGVLVFLADAGLPAIGGGSSTGASSSGNEAGILAQVRGPLVVVLFLVGAYVMLRLARQTSAEARSAGELTKQRPPAAQTPNNGSGGAR